MFLKLLRFHCHGKIDEPSLAVHADCEFDGSQTFPVLFALSAIEGKVERVTHTNYLLINLLA